MTRQPTIVVFLGPTLPVAEAASILDATWLQPASQGDIILAAHACRPDLMVLIDGTFQDRPAVRHKEILWAMAQGIAVLGAASMGAIRAAELAPFGMAGAGRIYRWYRRFPLAPDDAVAIQSGPPETGYINLTDSLVDLQASFSNLVRKGLVTGRERNTLLANAAATHFRERNFRDILRRSGIAEERLRDCLGHRVGLKQADAREALLRARHPASIDSGRARIDFTPTRSFIRDLENGGIDPEYLYTYARP